MALQGALALALPAAAPPLAARPLANDCSDPYWQDSLRCAALDPAEPQPVPAPPGSPGQIGEYTRVDLESDWSVRCLDGTRPILYVDPAVGGPSDRWLITFTGGGSCGAIDLGDGHLGQLCATLCLGGEASEMGTAAKPSTKNLGDDPGASQGILRTAPTANPVFAASHRVRIETCSDDRYNGSATHAGATADPPGAPPNIAYDLFSHGRKIVELALGELRDSAALGSGLSYTTWIEQDGAVVETEESLPPLERAEQVVLLGHSGGAHGLYHAIDGHAASLRAWPAFEGDVRGVLDANVVHGPENEAHLEDSELDLYDHLFSGTSPEFGAWDAEPYYTGSEYAQNYASFLASPTDSFAAILEASCIAAHAGDDTEWMCLDRTHLLANHLATPVFAREDFSDPNREHTNNGNGHVAEWGPPGDYPHCAALGGSPCPPLLAAGDGSPHEQRLAAQATRLLADLRFRSELALGDDPSGPVPTLYLWLPDCVSHTSACDDHQFHTVTLSNGASSLTLRDGLESFVAAAATGVVAGRIAGLGGDVALCSGDLPFRDGFESGDTYAW